MTYQAPAAAIPDAPATGSFQNRVLPWLLQCFGADIAADMTERTHRFLEEALELVQACGCTASEARQLVDYVYARDVGDRVQETGGVMVTLAALCSAAGIDMAAAGESELGRIWGKIETIRAKQAAKPKHGPLPEAAAAETVATEADTVFGTMSLGALIEALTKCPIGASVQFQFCHAAPGELHSYRGWYEHLAVTPEIGDETVTVAALLDRLIAAERTEFEGWKGGTYRMDHRTPVWVDRPRDCSGTAIVGVRRDGDHRVVLITEQVDD